MIYNQSTVSPNMTNQNTSQCKSTNENITACFQNKQTHKIFSFEINVTIKPYKREKITIFISIKL
jgi:hypothetical protein